MVAWFLSKVIDWKVVSPTHLGSRGAGWEGDAEWRCDCGGLDVPEARVGGGRGGGGMGGGQGEIHIYCVAV